MSQTQSPLDALEKHTDLWFSDGSVVLRAENALFRVHKSCLARQSVCFRDMFNIPQPTSGSGVYHGDSFEGCPVVTLHDSAEDLGHLLIAIYDGPTFRDNGREDFQVVSGILRLSTKYMIDGLREKALKHLTVAWPSRLRDWDAREEQSRIYDTDASSPGHRYPSPIAIINLAREIDAPSLLPSAFYDLSRYSFNQILEPMDDEAIYMPPSSTFSPSHPLSLQDMQKLSLGKEAVQNAIAVLIRSMGSTRQSSQLHGGNARGHARKNSGGRTSASQCMTMAACKKDFAELVDLAAQHYLFDREKGCADPLYVAEELGQLKSGGLGPSLNAISGNGPGAGSSNLADALYGECKACAMTLESWASRERERLWRLIPTWFRLEGWGGGEWVVECDIVKVSS